MNGNAYIPAPTGDWPSFHGRRNGFGNIAWADGHVQAMKPKLVRKSYSKGSVPAENFKALGLGDIDDDGNPDTDELFALTK